MDRAWRYVGSPEEDRPKPLQYKDRLLQIGDVVDDDMTEDYRFVVIVKPEEV